MADTPSVNDHFVRALYDHLLKTLKKFGPIEQDPKKTSIYINRNSALVGVETRKEY